MTEKKTLVKYRLIDNWEIEKKEAWLNDLANQGWTLKRPQTFRYEFEKTQPSEYIIRLQVLEGKPTKPKVADYLALMESTGAQLISVASGVAFFRRPTALGSFEIFSDRESRIAYLGRLIKQRAFSAVMMYILVFQHLHYRFTTGGRFRFLLAVALLSAVLSAVSVSLSLFKTYRQRKKLQKEQELLE